MANFGDTTVGYSFKQAETYLENLNNELIEDTIKLISNKREDVNKVLEESWRGQACDKFEDNFKSATKELAEKLRALKTTMTRVVATLEEEMINRDKNIVGGND